jgi:hypothetical protein
MISSPRRIPMQLAQCGARFPRRAVRPLVADPATLRHYFTAQFGTLSGLVTFGNGAQRSACGSRRIAAFADAGMGMPPPRPPKASAHLGDAPEVSRPLQTLVLDGVLAAARSWALVGYPDRQALYADGIAACKVRADGLVAIDRFVTTYQKSAAGVPMARSAMSKRCSVDVRDALLAHGGLEQALRGRRWPTTTRSTSPRSRRRRSVRNTLIHAYNDLVALGVLRKGRSVRAICRRRARSERREPAQRLSAGRCRQSVARVRGQHHGVLAISDRHPAPSPPNRFHWRPASCRARSPASLF